MMKHFIPIQTATNVLLVMALIFAVLTIAFVVNPQSVQAQEPQGCVPGCEWDYICSNCCYKNYCCEDNLYVYSCIYQDCTASDTYYCLN